MVRSGIAAFDFFLTAFEWVSHFYISVSDCRHQRQPSADI